MRPIATDGVAWSVGQSVMIVSPAKTVESLYMPFGMGPQNHALDGVQIPHVKGQF